MSDAWYYADNRGRTGPVPFRELKDALAKLPNAREILVWRDGFPDWKKAGEVAELWPQGAAPPLPPTHTPAQAGFQPDPGRTAASLGNIPDLWFGFKGRANRAKYWLVALTNIVILMVLAGVLFGALPPMAAMVIMGLVYIGFFVSFLAISAKRLHDRNKPNWWLVIFVVIPMLSGLLAMFMGDTGAIAMLLGLVQFVFGIWAFVELGCLRGTVGPNDYGEDPLAGRS